MGRINQPWAIEALFGRAADDPVAVADVDASAADGRSYISKLGAAEFATQSVHETLSLGTRALWLGFESLGLQPELLELTGVRASAHQLRRPSSVQIVETTTCKFGKGVLAKAVRKRL